jgi:hypothetical protein
MASFKNIEVADWVASRIMNFLNHARSVEDITNHPDLKDNPNTGTDGVTIGPTVAERIIQTKLALPYRRYRFLSELEGIQGFGEDKFNDLVYSFGQSASEYFKKAMYNGVILDNWELTDHTVFFDNEAAFLRVVNNTSNFKEWVGHQVQVMEQARTDHYAYPKAKGLLVQKSFMEVFEIAHYGAIAFGFYFYQFDADNWFSFESVRQECEKYLSYNTSNRYRLELRMFKGFNAEGLRATSTTQGMLPVVVNYGEQSISIWNAQLND